MNNQESYKGWRWKQDPAHRKAFLDALADQIKMKYEGDLAQVPRNFAIKFSKWFAPISYYGFGYGDGIKCGGIQNMTEWALDRQPVKRLGVKHPAGLITRTEYRLELSQRGIRVD
jgi:hypothetical protein